MELSGKIKRRPLKVLIDSESIGNFISDQVVASLQLKVVEDSIRQKLILPDKSIIWAGGWVDFLLTCGEYVRRISARVFPSLYKELVLGMPWLVMEDPDISWRNRSVAVQQKGSFIQLPVLRPAGNITQIDEINMCSAKQMSLWFRRRKVERAFVGFIRAVPGEAENSRKSVNLETTVADSGQQPMESNVESTFRSDMPESIKAVLSEFKDVFPVDLPAGRPPVRLGHEFKIGLEDDPPPVHRPIHKLSPMEVAEAKRHIQYMFEHGFIRPSRSPYSAPVLFAPKKDGGLQFCIDYWWLNEKTIRNRYRLPLPEKMFDRLGGSPVFIKIDLQAG